jgi:hypothetical protein
VKESPASDDSDSLTVRPISVSVYQFPVAEKAQ